MLPKDSLSKIIDYFYIAYPGEEIRRAGMEFFGFKKSGQLKGIKMNEMQSGLFNEWLLFDYKMTTGQTLIENYIGNNFVLPEDRRMYEDLLATNQYGLFEVKKVVPEISLVLRGIIDNKKYEVMEKKGTRGVKAGNLIFSRLAHVGGVWQMVGADTPVFATTELSPNAKEVFAKVNRVTIKDAYRLAAGGNGADENNLELGSKIDAPVARGNLVHVLKKSNLNQYVSVETIEYWCREKADKISSTQIIRILAGLAIGIGKDGIKELADAVFNFYNTVGQSRFEGKSPQEKIEEMDSPNFRTEIISFEDKWLEDVARAHDMMHKFKYDQAIAAFGKAFVSLKNESAIKPDIYRLYANKALCHFNRGERYIGKKMIDMALEMNPNYDFAQKMLRDYDAGEYDLIIEAGETKVAMECFKDSGKSKKINRRIAKINIGQFKKIFGALDSKIAQNMEKSGKERENKKMFEDPAAAYFNFIKELKINLATLKLTQTEIFAYNRKGEKIEAIANFCSCGSGKKYKKCCGK